MTYGRTLIRLPLALWVERRRRRLKFDEGLRWWVATLWLLRLYMRYGTDEQVDDIYRIMHTNAGYRDFPYPSDAA